MNIQHLKCILEDKFLGVKLNLEPSSDSEQTFEKLWMILERHSITYGKVVLKQDDQQYSVYIF